MDDRGNTENNIDEKNPDIFETKNQLSPAEKIVSRIMGIIFPTAFGLAAYILARIGILDSYPQLTNISRIFGIIAFTPVFIFFYKIFKNMRWGAHTTRNNIFDYDLGDINNSQNPFSYTTPGSPYYSYSSIDRDRSNDSRSAFSDSDSYYNR